MSEKPWFGKRCASCDAPLNYAQASRGLIPGLCGKCTDEAKRSLRDELRRELANDKAVVVSGGGGGRSGGGGLGLGLAVGLVLGAGACVGAAAFAPGPWQSVVSAVAPASPKK